MKVAYFHIKNGELVNKYSVKKAFDLPDGNYELKIVKRNRRSLLQNSYYWAAVVPLVHEGLRDMGNDVSLQETHDFLKARFNYKEIVNQVTGEVLNVPLSTTELNKEQFGIYIERITQFAAEYLNVTIPAPNSQMALYE